MVTRAPRTAVDVRSMARSHTETMLRVLSSIAKQAKAPASARVQAAGILLERGWGKSEQAHVGVDGGDIRVTIRQIIENVDDSAMKVIEHEDQDEGPATP
jgi:hypothetical protein